MGYDFRFFSGNHADRQFICFEDKTVFSINAPHRVQATKQRVHYLHMVLPKNDGLPDEVRKGI